MLEQGLGPKSKADRNADNEQHLQRMSGLARGRGKRGGQSRCAKSPAQWTLNREPIEPCLVFGAISQDRSELPGPQRGQLDARQGAGMSTGRQLARVRWASESIRRGGVGERYLLPLRCLQPSPDAERDQGRNAHPCARECPGSAATYLVGAVGAAGATGGAGGAP